MFPVDQLLSTPSACPKCHATNDKASELFFQGIHILQKVRCKNCGLRYLSTIPIGHTRKFSVRFSADGKHIHHDSERINWLVKPLVESVVKGPAYSPVITKKDLKMCDKVVFLNCLDNCYGHVIFKLLSSWRHIKGTQEIGLILLIPRIFEWMIPDGVAEVWFMEGPLYPISKGISQLDSFVKTNFKRYKEVHISRTILDQDQSKINFEIFFKMPRFALSKFKQKPCCVTFVLRDNRYWHNSRILSFLYLTALKFKILSFFRKIFIARQNSLVNKTIKRIRKEHRDVQFNVIGIGNPGGIISPAIDKRTAHPSQDTEREWCEISAKSHIVVGVHGSNMLVPSALAAGVIDIVPRFKKPNIGQDTLNRVPDRLEMGLIQYVDEYTDPKEIARRVDSMLNARIGV